MLELLLCVFFATCWSAENFANLGGKRCPVRDLVFVILKPRFGDVYEIEGDVFQLDVVIPSVVIAYSFEAVNPVFYVLVAKTGEGFGVTLPTSDSPRSCW